MPLNPTGSNPSSNYMALDHMSNPPPQADDSKSSRVGAGFKIAGLCLLIVCSAFIALASDTVRSSLVHNWKICTRESSPTMGKTQDAFEKTITPSNSTKQPQASAIGRSNPPPPSQIHRPAAPEVESESTLPIQVLIKTGLIGKDLWVDVTKGQTVGDIKQKIREEEGVPDEYDINLSGLADNKDFFASAGTLGRLTATWKLRT